MLNFQSVNPYSQLLVSKIDFISENELSFKLDRAWQAYSLNKGSEVESRLKNVQNLIQLLRSESAELAKLMTNEMGKAIGESLTEIDKCERLCSYYLAHAEELLAPYRHNSDVANSRVEYKPLGVILGIMPWNFPFWQVFRFALPSLIVGNSVLLKHAPNVPLCALKLEKLFVKAGFPSGSYQNVFASEKQVEQILADPRVKGVSLTGSEKAGRIVAGIAGRNLKKQVLELGGSDPFIVMPSANLSKAIKWGVKSRLINTGQSCIAAKRFIVHESVYDAFLKDLKETLSTFKIGDPLDTSVNLGPMARQDLVEKLKQQVDESMKQGAVVEAYYMYAEEHPLFAPIIILSNIKKGMPAYAEELFGPVFSLFKVKSLEEAIVLANDTAYGLGASLWTEDALEQKTGEDELEAGSVFINAMVKSDVNLPFGGIKNSGYGRELAEAGLKEFCNVKTIVKGRG